MVSKPPILIAFAGRMGSGKTTAANHIVKSYGAEKFTFATPIKKIAKDVFDLSEEQLNGTLEQKNAVDPRYGISSRTAAQNIGAAIRKHLGEYSFAERLFQDGYADSSSTVRTIDDVRHVEEALEVIKRGGHLITLICTDDLNTENPYGNHESESQVDLVTEMSDIVIKSHRTANSLDLLLKVESAVRSCLSEIDWYRLEEDNHSYRYKVIDHI